MAEDIGAKDRATIAVLDVGKTNVKLHAASATGRLLKTLSAPNVTLPGSLWRHHDLNSLGNWVFEGLHALCKDYPIDAFIASGHGSAGMLIGPDPDDGDGTVLPMIDYEQILPPEIREGYRDTADSLAERGSAIMMGAAHQARQLYWMQQVALNQFQRAKWFVNVPQYWAWRLSGIAVSETTSLSAQSQLWNPLERRWSPIVARCGWEHLMPPFANAWQSIGHIRPELAERHRLPKQLRIFTGIHDSSANFYHYQAAGLADAAVISTGTWIVGLSGQKPLPTLDERLNLSTNTDVHGNILGGVLTMGGREFSLVAGLEDGGKGAEAGVVVDLLMRSTMALPSFGDDDGLFPGSAGTGRIIGFTPKDGIERKALAVIYAALLTAECLQVLNVRDTVVLDGSFVRDPLYPALVASFRDSGKTVYNSRSNGVAGGAALLVNHETRTQSTPVELEVPDDLPIAQGRLHEYAHAWRSHARTRA